MVHRRTIATKDQRIKRKRELDRNAQQLSRERKAGYVSSLEKQVKVLEALKEPEAGGRNDLIIQLMDENRCLEQENMEYRTTLFRIGFMATDLSMFSQIPSIFSISH